MAQQFYQRRISKALGCRGGELNYAVMWQLLETYGPIIMILLKNGGYAEANGFIRVFLIANSFLRPISGFPMGPVNRINRQEQINQLYRLSRMMIRFLVLSSMALALC